MASRLELQTMLENLLESRNVYYNPPMSIKMKYPAVVYSRKAIDNVYADNAVYEQFKAYELLVIDEDPDSVIVDKVSKLPRCRFDRHYTADNLNHDSFTIYF